jgi:hypothetical protein
MFCDFFLPWHNPTSKTSRPHKYGARMECPRENGTSSALQMKNALLLPRKLSWALRRLGIRLPAQLLVVSVPRQRMVWLMRSRSGDPPAPPERGQPCPRSMSRSCRREPPAPEGWPSRQDTPHTSPQGNYYYFVYKHFVISTSRFGVGQEERSNRTPLGLHRVAAKIGEGQPVGTVFESRKAIGYTWQGYPEAPIAHRIMWLEGLETGLNRKGQVDSFKRYIYVHGVGDELTLGRPASRGCIQLSSNDLIYMFDRLSVGTLVWNTEDTARPAPICARLRCLSS